MRIRAGLIVAAAMALGMAPGLYAADGKAVFTGKCLECHGVSGKGGKVAPGKYAVRQWQRFFSENRHARKLDINSMFTQDELDAVLEYLTEHAADSEKPEAAGLR
ncbi:MAG: c-type cytochrome [Syntrophaceae bacterium]